MAGPVRISIVADGGAARRELAQTSSAVDRFGGRVKSGLGTAGRVAAVGAAGLSAALVGIGKEAIATEASFSQTMNLIGAATGAAAPQLGQLRDLAKEMGAQTSFSANEAADAMLELSKAGLTPATIQAGALEGTLTLAAAGGTDLATAATVASNALNTFGLKGKDMASVAAALAGGANASSASVESLAFGLSQVGPGATNAGLSLQQTVAVLSAFDAAGIKGSDAGTSLKTMLTRLVPTTEKAATAMNELGLDFTNADGSFQSITQVAQQLQDRLGGLSAEQRTQALATIFGSDATRAATVLVKEGAKGLQGYIRATKDQGAAQDLAAARMAGTAGALERLSGAAETSKLVIGEALAPVVVKVADYLSENMVPATEKAVAFFEKLVSAGQDIAAGQTPEEFGQIGDALAGVDWDKAVEGGTAIVDSLREIGGAVGSAGIDVLTDGISVTAEVLELAADHSDELAAALPFVIAGFAAYKLAVGGAKVATAALIPLRFAELAAQRAQTAAIRAMTAALLEMAAAQRAATQGAWVNGTWYSAVRNNGRAAAGAGNAAGAAATQVSGLGAAAKGAAGAAGMAALTYSLFEASSEGNSLKSVLSGVAGGAGIGAMFGPIGALVGAGVGGGLSALVGAFGDAKNSAEETRVELLRTEGFENAKRTAEDLREALIGVKNAYGETVRAAVEASFTDDEGKIAADVAKLREYGVSMDTIVSATLGQAEAQRLVERAFSEYGSTQERVLAGAKAAYDEVSDGARDLVTATGQVIVNGQKLSNEEIDQYRQAYENAKSSVYEAEAAQAAFASRVTQADIELAGQRRSVQQLAADLGVTVAQYRRFPRAVRTEFESEGLRQTSEGALRLLQQYKGLQNFRAIRAVISAPGVKTTRAEVRELGREYKLTPKQVRTLLRVEGFDVAIRNTKRVTGALEDTGRVQPDLRGFKATLDREVDESGRIVTRGGEVIQRSLEDGPKRARADLGGYRSSIDGGVASAKGAAYSGGYETGSQLGGGFVAGVASRSGEVQGAVRSSVRGAINAGKAEARVQSPSRETAYIGQMLGRGLETGIASTTASVRRRGRSLLAAALNGITGGSSGVSASIDRVTQLIGRTYDTRLRDTEKRLTTAYRETQERLRKNLKGDKLDKALRKAERDYDKSIRDARSRNTRNRRGLLKSLADENKALAANGRLQDQNAQALDQARSKYRGLVDAANQYAAAIKASFVSYGSVISLGQGTGFADASQLIDQLRARAASADRFAAVIRQLSGRLNATSLQQLIDAGVEGGLGTAEAILAGGASAITEINQLTAQIASAGGGLGEQMRKKFRQAGIDAAAGLVAGLEREQRRLDRAAERIGAQIVRAIKKELGIKSPSRVFREVGEDTMAGLAIGLDETYARRLGARVGTGVKDGFARPDLARRASFDAPAMGGPGGPGVQVQTVRFRFTAEQTSQMQRGREVVADAEVYFRNGGRSTTRWGGG